jgi:hypothetical protein
MKAEEFAARAPDEVLNQLTPLENYNLYECDNPLREFGALLGGVRNFAAGRFWPTVTHRYCTGSSALRAVLISGNGMVYEPAEQAAA